MKSLQDLHTFHLKSDAKNVIELTTVSELTAFIGSKNNQQLVVLGSGSNCLFLGDYQGTIVLNKLKGKAVSETSDSYIINVAAGEDWHEFVEWTIEHRYFGLENLALIPGTVGACPIQNIGAYGREVSDFISKVKYFDLTTGELTWLDKEKCNFGYRNSVFKSKLKHTAVIVEVEFALPKVWLPCVTYGELKELKTPSATDIFNTVIDVRKRKLPDPKVIGNAGSFYKNPIISIAQANKLQEQHPSIPIYPISECSVKIAAGWLIDQCGLKGFEMGNVGVHKNQALVLTNVTGQAKGSEILALAKYVQSKVKDRFDIDLEPEVRLIGEQGEQTFQSLVV